MNNFAANNCPEDVLKVYFPVIPSPYPRNLSLRINDNIRHNYFVCATCPPFLGAGLLSSPSQRHCE